MRKTLLIVGSSLLMYILLTGLIASFLGLPPNKAWILRIALWVIGLVAAALIVWFLADKQKKEQAAAAGQEEAPSGGEDLAVLIREAEKKLAAAQLGKGARIGNLPAILLLGETSSTKTSIVLYSGLEPELLAGQVYQDANVTSTRSANLWFTRRTLFVEAGGKLLDDQAAFAYLAKRLQPRKLGAVVGKGGQAPRAMLVCVDAERLTVGAQAVSTLARNLRARLGEIAGLFGIQLPVYVLFTKADRLSFFADFVRNLTKEEATQPLGVTLPIAGLSSGIYAEEQAARLGGAFDQIFRALCNARPEFLARENDATKLPGAYEFPREFRKLRGALVQFLTDLCRPSELAVGPFLRGFYFCGVRPVTVQEIAPVPEARTPEKQSSPSAREATAMFRIPTGGQAAAPQAQRVAVSRRVPQWLFLTHFFNDVLLADRVAMGASGSSTKTSLWRRVLLVAAAVVALVFCIGFTVSFVLNRGLETQVVDALKGTAVAPVAPNLASLDSLKQLDALRRSLMALKEYKGELRYHWGMYVGDDLYPGARRAYFKRFKELLFGQTQNSLVTSLATLPPTPGPTYDDTYGKLKAYLITTSNPDKSTPENPAPQLLDTWKGSQNVDPERLDLARKQFDFYSSELLIDDPFGKQNDSDAIEKARRYLNQFGELDRVYQNMKADAPKTGVNFNRQYPGSASYVVDGYEVAGAFTKQGWDFMTTSFRRVDKYAKGEAWVLGPQGAAIINDQAKLREQLQARYENDFIAQWRAYLKSARVVGYANLKDASDKLGKLTNNDSPLLALFALASLHTAVADDKIKKVFQPAAAVVPPGAERFIGPSNQDYVSALTKLQISVDGVAKAADPNDPAAASQTQAAADSARVSTKQLAQSFNPDPDNHVDASVQQLLLDPITYTEGLLRGQGAAALNAAGQGLCSKFRAALGKYPFNPASKQDAAVTDLNGIFHAPDGALWVFYEGSLKKLLVKQGGEYVPVSGGNPKLSPAFVSFFNQAAKFSEALYAGGSADPHFTYTLRAMPTDTVKQVSLEIDGQKLDSSGGSAAKPFTWKGSDPHGVSGTFGSDNYSFANETGLWAVFHFFDRVDNREHSPTGELLDWYPRQGNPPTRTTQNGKPVSIRFELNMGATPHVFEKNFFKNMACVSEVAKP